MNVFERQSADQRQTPPDAEAPAPSLFRKRYRQLTPDEVALHDQIKDKAEDLAQLFGQINTMRLPMAPGVLGNVATNQGANVTLALRHLEDAVYRAVKALTA